MDTADVKAMTIEQLRDRARRLGTDGAEDLSRDELIAALTDTDDAMTRSEERLVVSTELWETGRARLRKYVVTEEVQITVPIRREVLRLEREPIVEGSRPAVEDPDVFGPAEMFGGPDGGTIFEVTLHQERPLVSTEIVPIERVRLAKTVHTEQELISGEVRKERIDVDVPGRAPKTIQ